MEISPEVPTISWLYGSYDIPSKKTINIQPCQKDEESQDMCNVCNNLLAIFTFLLLNLMRNFTHAKPAIFPVKPTFLRHQTVILSIFYHQKKIVNYN